MSLTSKDIRILLTAQDASTTHIVGFAPSPANGSLITYQLEDNYLRWHILDPNIEFLDPGAWKKVILLYSSPSTTQVRSGTFTAVTSWDSYSQTGLWSIKKVIIVNKMGEDLVIDGSSFPSSNNILVS
jgi:hypothetical protein